MEFLQEELDEILSIFSQEGAEILQSMDKNLLLLEKKPNSQDIAMHLFRDAHSLKGSARMLGFVGIQNIAHKIEDVLGLVREGKVPVTSNITDIISDALNCISELIKKTVEQKSEFISEESSVHIERLNAICDSTYKGIVEQIPKITVEEKKIEKDVFVENFEKFEELITNIVLIYSKLIQNGKYEKFPEILSAITELSRLLQEAGQKNLYELSISILDLAEESNKTDNINEEILYALTLKISDFTQSFSQIATEKGLAPKDYYEVVNKISQENENQADKKAENKDIKNKDILELIEKIIETSPDISKNKQTCAEIKSLLNEVISRLGNTKFKKIFQTILSVVLNFEKSNVKLKSDTIEALKEILESSSKIIENSESNNSFNDFTEEIELLNQKASIIAQMANYDLSGSYKNYRSPKAIKTVDWSRGFDTSSIKTLRVNSDKLDKLANQIGNLIVTRIKSHENIGLIRNVQDELLEWQKHYHKIGYYMKFYEKKYVRDSMNSQSPDLIKRKDSFLNYNKQLIQFHNSNAEKINRILNNLNIIMKELQENNVKLNTTTSEIENMVKSMRILPLSTVFNLFPRMVHNIAKEKDKNIELVIEGGDVSADKKIIEMIKIPIMHIVRNSIDHGIEPPYERERIGKDKTGVIVIEASQKESKIVISIKDDGAGINIDKIKQKAIEKGFVTKEAADNMSKEQLANFIFYPGFSTGDTITELSGRGFGLDIVHTKISQLNGRIDVYSEEHKGTVVTMELPTTMATMRTFIILENNRLFAIPASSIQTVLRIVPSDIKKRGDKHYYIYNDEAIPICSLSSILDISKEEENQDKYTLVVIKSESITTGIIVQKLIGDEEILNKKLPEPLLRVKNISGITTLANGEMCLLLNVSDLLNSSRISSEQLNTTKSLTLQDNSKYNILIVDDSITTRRLLKNVLSSNGYNAETVSNAKSALRKLEVKDYDLILSDYEMPEMDGLEFIRLVRKNEKTKNIPVVVVSSFDNQDIKDKLFKLNIQDFIKKEYFEQQSFIRTVNRYLNFSANNAKK